MASIEKIAKSHKLSVIEDGSQAFGAVLDGRKCGNFGVILPVLVTIP